VVYPSDNDSARLQSTSSSFAPSCNNDDASRKLPSRPCCDAAARMRTHLWLLILVSLLASAYFLYDLNGNSQAERMRQRSDYSGTGVTKKIPEALLKYKIPPNPSNSPWLIATPENEACCDRAILYAHKFGMVMTRALFETIPANRLWFSPHAFPRLNSSRPQQSNSNSYRHVMIVRNIFDAMISGTYCSRHRTSGAIQPNPGAVVTSFSTVCIGRVRITPVR